MRTAKSVTQIDSLIRSALESFVRDIRSDDLWRREHELVNLFVFGHLVPKSRGSGVISDLTQIGIGTAVPQLKRRWTRRKDSDVCKDVVIWPEPGMTCWDDNGKPEYFPLSVLEWKSLNRQDRGPRLPKRKRERYEKDLQWLCDMSSWTMDRNLPFVGYRVFVDQTTRPIHVAVDRAFRGTPSEKWWSR